jgi:hypothetical protein
LLITYKNWSIFQRRMKKIGFIGEARLAPLPRIGRLTSLSLVSQGCAKTGQAVCVCFCLSFCLLPRLGDWSIRSRFGLFYCVCCAFKGVCPNFHDHPIVQSRMVNSRMIPIATKREKEAAGSTLQRSRERREARALRVRRARLKVQKWRRVWGSRI